MSTPRPAMLVEIVTAPCSPARAMIAASASSFRAFNTLCGMCPSRPLRRSDSSTLDVPTSTGRPVACVRWISSTTARSFSLTPGNRLIRMVNAHNGPVRRNHLDVESVDLAELPGLGRGRAGHSAHLGVQADEVLDGDRPEDPALRLLRHPLFHLERGLEPRGPASILGDAALELVHRQDRVVVDDVVDVARAAARARGGHPARPP